MVSRPGALAIVGKHGDAAAAVLVKHAGGIAEPAIEKFGAPAVRALTAAGPQGGRRICMMVADGDLAKIGRTEELLEVIAKYGDRAVKFVWENKGALAVTATLAAFLADPETFLSAAEGVTVSVVESAVPPLTELPSKAVTGVVGASWTSLLALAAIGSGVAWASRRRPAGWRLLAAARQALRRGR